MDRRRFLTFVTAAALLSPLPAQAQRRAPAPSGRASPAPAPVVNPELVRQAEQARAATLRATTEYRVSLDRLVAFYEADVGSAAALVARQRELAAQGLIAARDVTESERALAEAQSHVHETRRRIAEADQLIVEASAAIELARWPTVAPGGAQTTAAFLRFNGRSAWSLADVGKLRDFFASHFGRALPVSAYGQTSVHDRLGFDHHNAIDVAVHPDSPEGQQLLGYLRKLGIPYLAFRAAVRGAATGAHVHVGPPSDRQT